MSPDTTILELIIQLLEHEKQSLELRQRLEELEERQEALFRELDAHLDEDRS